ncbi:MAG TPA: hypothetical protein VFY16_11290 [Gemmatimonadaceae bacterium]|nr:hypothetical protein [Gemmatimonadaceae bacterium]
MAPGTSRTPLVFLIGVVAGVLLLGAARFFAAPPDAHDGVHYHANFALFVDGQRVDLTGEQFMEDVAACAADPSQQRPEDRVHLHDGNMDVVHVHDAGAAWGHLFTNLGFGLGDDHLVPPDGRKLVSDADTRVTFVLNGRPERSVRNRVIRSGDRLLVDVGAPASDSMLQARLAQVASNAEEFNAKLDPATCSGGHVPRTTGERLRRAFWY